jgi:hypothetical protein
VAGPLEAHELTARQLGEPHAARERDDAVVGALDDDNGAAHAAAVDLRLLLVRQIDGERLTRDQHLRRCLVRVGDEVLDRLRRVRLREDLAAEELEEAVIVAQPVALVVLRPALVGVELRLPRVGGARRVRLGDERDRRRDQERGEYPLGMPDGEVHPVERAE